MEPRTEEWINHILTQLDGILAILNTMFSRPFVDPDANPRICKWCSGQEAGYHNSQYFQHTKRCPALLNAELQRTHADEPDSRG